MSILVRAIRLAVIVEVVSCIGMVFQTEPYGFWDKWCDALGWPPRAVSYVLADFFGLLNFPAVFLSYHLFGSFGFEVFNGRLVISSVLGIVVLLVQCSLWTLIFFGLFHLVRRVKLLFRRHDA
jgi:hypothetical protein